MENGTQETRLLGNAPSAVEAIGSKPFQTET